MIFPLNLESLIQSYGYLAVFALMFGESAFVPFPSEITMTFAGYLAGRGIFNFWAAVLTGTIANVAGATLAYWVGRSQGAKWTRRALKKWGHVLLIKEEEFDRASEWFKRYGPPIVFVSRLLPVVRAFISLPAGIAKMRFLSFIIYTTIGSFFWVLTLAFVGQQLGERWHLIAPYFENFKLVILALGVLSILFGIYKLQKRRTRK